MSPCQHVTIMRAYFWMLIIGLAMYNMTIFSSIEYSYTVCLLCLNWLHNANIFIPSHHWHIAYHLNIAQCTYFIHNYTLYNALSVCRVSYKLQATFIALWPIMVLRSFQGDITDINDVNWWLQIINISSKYSINHWQSLKKIKKKQFQI